MSTLLTIYLSISAFGAGMDFRQSLKDGDKLPSVIMGTIFTFVFFIPVWIWISLGLLLDSIFRFLELGFIFEILFTEKHSNMSHTQLSAFYNWHIYHEHKSKRPKWQRRYKNMIVDLALRENGLSRERKLWDYTVNMKKDERGDWIYFLQHPLDARAFLPESIGIYEVPEDADSKDKLIEIADKLNLTITPRDFS